MATCQRFQRYVVYWNNSFISAVSTAFFITSHYQSGSPDLPFELVFFQLPNDSRGSYSFDENIKYPPYRRCIIPKRLSKKTGLASGSTAKNWRVYWSRLGWDAYYYSSGEEVITWKRYGGTDVDYWEEGAIPIFVLLVWFIIIALICMVLFPLLSMCCFRALFFIWNGLTHRRVVQMFRYVIIKNAKFRRESILRAFQDAGHRPPFYRYTLPLFVRYDPHEAVPAELDETDEEFWSSDEEVAILNNDGNNQGTTGRKSVGQLNRQKPTPEFLPEYTSIEEESHVMSDEMFAYLLKVKEHGMFAVWTEGIEDINLVEVAQSNYKSQIISADNSKSQFGFEGFNS